VHRVLPLLLLSGCGLFGLPFDDDAFDTGGDEPVGPPGTLDDAWRKVRAEITVLDGNQPGSVFAQPIDVPDRIETTTVEAGERQVESLVRIEDDKVVTYAWQVGDQVHYRLVHPTAASGASWIVQDATVTRELTFDGERLGERTYVSSGDVTVLTESDHVPVAAFPPEGWPAERIDFDLPEAW
jgi:hypothetical protein